MPKTRLTGAISRGFAPAGHNIVWQILIRDSARLGVNDSLFMRVGICLVFQVGFWALGKCGVEWGPALVGVAALAAATMIGAHYLSAIGTILLFEQRMKGRNTALDLLVVPSSSETFTEAFQMYFFYIHFLLATVTAANLAVFLPLQDFFPLTPWDLMRGPWALFEFIFASSVAVLAVVAAGSILWAAYWAAIAKGPLGYVLVILGAMGFVVIAATIQNLDLFPVNLYGLAWGAIFTLYLAGAAICKYCRHHYADDLRERLFG